MIELLKTFVPPSPIALYLTHSPQPTFPTPLVPHPFTSTHLPHYPCILATHLNPPSPLHPLPLYLIHSLQSTFSTPLVSQIFTTIHLPHTPCTPIILLNPPFPLSSPQLSSFSLYSVNPLPKLFPSINIRKGYKDKFGSPLFHSFQ